MELARSSNIGLRKIKLSSNVPQYIGNMTEIIKLDLSSNLLNGTIPNTFDNLVNATFLDFGRIKFVRPLPPSIGNLKKLTLFMLSNNAFSGSIP